jgi:hypothetical protein
MTEIISGRVTGRIEGDFVVFLIGMRINKPWKPHKWLPALLAVPKMLKELEAAPPEVGFLGHNGLDGKPIVQYWRSFDHLERYARPERVTLAGLGRIQPTDERDARGCRNLARDLQGSCWRVRGYVQRDARLWAWQNRRKIGP